MAAAAPERSAADGAAAARGAAGVGSRCGWGLRALDSVFRRIAARGLLLGLFLGGRRRRFACTRALLDEPAACGPGRSGGLQLLAIFQRWWRRDVWRRGVSCFGLRLRRLPQQRHIVVAHRCAQVAGHREPDRHRGRRGGDGHKPREPRRDERTGSGRRHSRADSRERSGHTWQRAQSATCTWTASRALPDKPPSAQTASVSASRHAPVTPPWAGVLAATASAAARPFGRVLQDCPRASPYPERSAADFLREGVAAPVWAAASPMTSFRSSGPVSSDTLAKHSPTSTRLNPSAFSWCSIDVLIARACGPAAVTRCPRASPSIRPVCASVRPWA